jgi:hypothetical protein
MQQQLRAHGVAPGSANKAELTALCRKLHLHDAASPHGAHASSSPRKATARSRAPRAETALAAQAWTVTITHFDDDYKGRGDDSASVSGPYSFSTREKAEDYLCSILLETLMEHAGSDAVAGCPHMWRPDGAVKRRYRQSLRDLEAAVEPLVRGEFVPRTMAWDIDPLMLDAKAVAHEPLLPDSDAEEGGEQAVGAATTLDRATSRRTR